jgi:hypothetical protein
MWEKILDLLHHLSPSLVALIGGSLILQRYFVRKANEASLIEAIIKDLESLRADSISYWSTDPSDANKAELESLGQKIISAIRALESDLKAYSKRYCKKRYDEFVQMMVDVNDACTCGKFQTAKRKADSGRVLPVSNTISRVKSELRKQKL